jgi:hypothetical protein
VVYAGIDVNLFSSLTGTAETLSVITVLVPLALAAAGLVVVIVDTSRIHRADAAVRVSAKGSVSHYPLYAHAQRWPPRHPASWVAVIFMLVAMTGITAYILPQEVNAWAYVVGAEKQDTFNPVSYSTCSVVFHRGCQAVAGLFFDGVALLLLYVLVVIVRETSPGRRHRISVPAGGAGGAHHPDGSHHRSSARRRAHGGQGRRSRRSVRTGR